MEKEEEETEVNDAVCAFKMVDGTTIFSESYEIDYEKGVIEFLTKFSWILVQKTNEKNETTLAVFSCTEMTMSPSRLVVPITSIILMSDMGEEVKQKVKRATFSISMPYEKNREGVKV
jgi:hypothetical protein